MGSVCADDQQHHHKFHNSHQLYLTKSIPTIDIPPRKLLSRRSHHPLSPSSNSSPMALDDAVFSKFLPCNNPNGDDDDDDPYSSDHFRMYEFKVRKCNRSRSHDWTDCPFAHPGEKARRRDPRRFQYSGTVCADFRKGHCGKGDNCELSHGVFECWLHPSRYRTEACKDGKNCKRKVCFFAHSARQLRTPPEISSAAEEVRKSPNLQNCCAYCHSVTASPTSTLMAVSRVSPPASPPISPVCSPAAAAGYCNYKEAILAELMANLEAMNLNLNQETILSQAAGSRNVNPPWVDMNFTAEEQPQFLMSPSTPASAPAMSHGSGFSKFLGAGEGSFVHGDVSGSYGNRMEDGGLSGPDLGWVNDLLT